MIEAIICKSCGGTGWIQNGSRKGPGRVRCHCVAPLRLSFTLIATGR